jgi:tRNA threonylcarbamoyladenosine biosynthesis protein TsaB
MNFWLCIASDYQFMHVALCSQQTIIENVFTDKTDSNKLLLTLIAQLLTKHHITINDLLYIGVNVGPAPYTSLRIAIATANGLAYAASLPLVRIDALLTMLQQHSSSYPTIALLNAFNDDIFYGIKTEETRLTGCEHIDQLLERLEHLNITEPCFIGNGTALHYDAIIKRFHLAHISQPIPEYADLTWLAKSCWHSWQEKQEITDELFPRYLKNIDYKNSISVK